jgi:hypothetical protein
MNSSFWQKNVFHYVFLGCGLFVLLTVIAMFTYPGGLYTGELTTHYDFFRNFFSDLGRITAEGGKSNLVSAILFFLALSIAGIGLIFFFIAFRQFFKGSQTVNIISLAGTMVGVASGLLFIGIACAPYDLLLDIHYQFVFWAFRTFFIAVSIYAYVIFHQTLYPHRYGWVFAAFAIFLAAYIGLLEFGPEASTPTGLVIQATGQKIIVYVSIISVMIQARLAYRQR